MELIIRLRQEETMGIEDFTNNDRHCIRGFLIDDVNKKFADFKEYLESITNGLMIDPKRMGKVYNSQSPNEDVEARHTKMREYFKNTIKNLREYNPEIPKVGHSKASIGAFVRVKEQIVDASHVENVYFIAPVKSIENLVIEMQNVHVTAVGYATPLGEALIQSGNNNNYNYDVMVNGELVRKGIILEIK